MELARRAAGGDGAAFVRLYDHYSAEVFASSLAASDSVGHAAEATQFAFLTMLRRPPAIDAPECDVSERLRAIALAAGAEAPAMNAGAGWLRSETVAKASARFDQDWSAYLTSVTPNGNGSVAEVVRAWAREGAADEHAARRHVVRDRAPKRRRGRLRGWLLPRAPLPRPLEPV